MKNKKRFVGLLLVSAFLSSQVISPALAWKISVPGLINTVAPILNHKKHDSTVKAPEHFKARGVWIKSDRDLDASLPQGDYYILLKPADKPLQPQETPWFRVNKQTIAHIIVQSSGVRRVEFRVTASSQGKELKLAQAAPKLPQPAQYPNPANDNVPRIPANDNVRPLIPSEEIGGTGIGIRVIFADIAASAVGAAIFVGTALVAILPPNSTSSNDTMDGYNATHPSSASQPQTQPQQNPRQQTDTSECFDEEFPAISSGKRPSQAPKDRREEIAWREKTGSEGQIIDRFPADTKRLAAAYGGSAVDWVRKAYLPQEMGLPEVHWLENQKLRLRVEFIFKDPCHIPPKDCDEMGSANALTGKTTRFNGKNPGPLSYQGVNEAKNFVNSAYDKIITNKWVRLYRVWGGKNKAGQYGGFWTRMPISYEQLKNPAFVQKLRDMFALPSDWNEITDITVREFKPGTVMYRGYAAKQAKYPQYTGKGEQIYLDEATRESFAVIGCPEK